MFKEDDAKLIPDFISPSESTSKPLRTTNLDVVNHDSERDAVGVQVLLQSTKVAAGHSDINGKLCGHRVAPEVQLESESQWEGDD